MEKKDKDIIKFIDKLYKDLYLSKEVLNHGNGNKYDKLNNIKTYLDKLEDVHNKASLGKHIDYLKKCYHDKYVIKRENIPEICYQKQIDLALKRGYGHVTLSEKDKKQIEDEIIENQKASLNKWIDYLLSEDAKFYPFWAKYWAFQGMLKLGNYDKKNREYFKRTEKTTEKFADLNREALAIAIDSMIKILNKEEISDEELTKIVKSGSFSKIYTYLINLENKNIIKREAGIWIKYDKGSNHIPLVESLQGYNTKWCTSGESTAKSQLQNGDFYVYYTLDENDEYKIPRIAIRMEGNSIGEIRGIAEEQNLESNMEKIVEEKIKDFPDKEKYYKKEYDMKELTKIYDKHQNNIELTKEELIFLYEIYDTIDGFGYEKDPRIEEIISGRNKAKKDIAFILNCKDDQVALNENEIKEDIVYYKGSLSDDVKYLKFLKVINGSLDLRSLTNAQGLELPQTVGGYLDLSSLTSLDGLIVPETFDYRIRLNNTIITKDNIAEYRNLKQNSEKRI